LVFTNKCANYVYVVLRKMIENTLSICYKQKNIHLKLSNKMTILLLYLCLYYFDIAFTFIRSFIVLFYPETRSPNLKICTYNLLCIATTMLLLLFYYTKYIKQVITLLKILREFLLQERSRNRFKSDGEQHFLCFAH